MIFNKVSEQVNKLVSFHNVIQTILDGCMADSDIDTDTEYQILDCVTDGGNPRLVRDYLKDGVLTVCIYATVVIVLYGDTYQIGVVYRPAEIISYRYEEFINEEPSFANLGFDCLAVKCG